MSNSTPRTRYFEELTCILKREGFEPQPLEDDVLPVHYGGEPLCTATKNGIRCFPTDISRAEKEKACNHMADTVARTKEYMTLMESIFPRPRMRPA